MADSPSTKVAKNFYLKQLAKYRREGESDEKAADMAQADTIKKFGKMPGGRI